jgi:protocatechuate 3,4-dioxygenase, beta subunit
MQKISIIFSLLITTLSTSACTRDAREQSDISNAEKTGDTLIGGRCEGCEAVFESPIHHTELGNTDTLPGFWEAGTKIMISGVIYKADGMTPAKDVVLYIYHTDQKGYYTPGKNAAGWEKRHGYMRGWLKTNESGEYVFYTIRPAPYPTATFPAHIHPTIKEPGKNEYYIDDFVFTDDPYVDDNYRKNETKRGGSGILTLVKGDENIMYAKRDIILSKNIPNYR